MRMKFVVALLLLVACGGTTGPGGIDPTVLITNHAQQDTLYFTWRDGQGIAGSVAALPGTTSCTKFLAQADSAYFEAHITVGLSTGTYQQHWFDPATRPAWTMETGSTQGGSNAAAIIVNEVTTEPC